MPHIFTCSIYIDEAQWVLTGTRITTAKAHVKTSEIVTENTLEIRGAGGRLNFFAQDSRTSYQQAGKICFALFYAGAR
jgi:hypothetical protein